MKYEQSDSYPSSSKVTEEKKTVLTDDWISFYLFRCLAMSSIASAVQLRIEFQGLIASPKKVRVVYRKKKSQWWRKWEISQSDCDPPPISNQNLFFPFLSISSKWLPTRQRSSSSEHSTKKSSWTRVFDFLIKLSLSLSLVLRESDDEGDSEPQRALESSPLHSLHPSALIRLIQPSLPIHIGTIS